MVLNKYVAGSWLLLLLSVLPSRAQVIFPEDSKKQDELEQDAGRQENQQEDLSVQDALDFYTTHPLAINLSVDEELFKFPFWNVVQAQAVISHLNRFGKIQCLEELQVIREFNEEDIRKLKPLLSFVGAASTRPLNFNNLNRYGTHQLLLRYQQAFDNWIKPQQESNSNYYGGTEKLLLRYKFQMDNRIRLGFTAEKDPGEALVWNSGQKGFDFYSAHLAWKGKGYLRQVILGDYSAQAGQGLCLWSGLSYGKSADVINIQKQARGIYPYSSSDENSFFRGIALSTAWRKFSSDIFISSHARDANLIIEENVAYASSLQSSGYHRTPGEQEDKHSLQERNAGILLNFQDGKTKAGMTLLATHFSHPVRKTATSYNQFQFNGKNNLNAGLHLSRLIGNFYFFSEIASSYNRSMAGLAGLQASLHPKISIATLFRFYSRNYQSLRAIAFAENTQVQNEQGYYTAIQWKAPKNLTLNIYADSFKFPWLKFQVNAPSLGSEYLAQLNWKPRRKVETYIRYQEKNKVSNSSGMDANTQQPVPLQQRNYRWHIRMSLNETWEWGSRAEYVNWSQQREATQTGYLIAQDLFCHPLGARISWSFRYLLFFAEDYKSRIYTYENDVLYSSSIPSFQGSGSRYYINSRIRINRNLDVWLRYAETFSKASIENSLQERKSEWKIQVRLKW